MSLPLSQVARIGAYTVKQHIRGGKYPLVPEGIDRKPAIIDDRLVVFPTLDLVADGFSNCENEKIKAKFGQANKYSLLKAVFGQRTGTVEFFGISGHSVRE